MTWKLSHDFQTAAILNFRMSPNFRFTKLDIPGIFQFLENLPMKFGCRGHIKFNKH